MLEFGKITQEVAARREALLREAEIRQMTRLKAAKRWIPPHVALAIANWLIQVGTDLKASYQPVNLGVPNSETRHT